MFASLPSPSAALRADAVRLPLARAVDAVEGDRRHRRHIVTRAARLHEGAVHAFVGGGVRDEADDVALLQLVLGGAVPVDELVEALGFEGAGAGVARGAA